jgi:ribosomal protein L23
MNMNGRIVIVDKPTAEQAVESMFGISVDELAKRIVSGQIKVVANDRCTKASYRGADTE